MGLVVTYYMPADASSGPWTEDLSDNVRLGTISGIVDEAELGAVGISSLLFDDPDATLGTSHYPDGIRGLKRIWIDETSCPSGDQRLFTGWFGDRRYRRGTDSLITGVARKLDATIVDSNTMLSFRVFAPVNGSNSTAYNASNSFIRPAETDLERVTALLTVPFLTSVHDTGFISTGAGVDMDACDYTGQHPADVLNDCAQQSGRNFFIRYDETANEFSLHYVDEDDLSDAATLRISNVLADVDYVTTFPPEPDAELVRDPSRVSAAVYLPFNGSNSPAYQTRIQTEYDYGWRDSSAPSSNVKTLAQANVRAARYLLTTSTEDDRITCTVKLPADVVTGIKQGQVVSTKFSHLPNGSNATWGPDFQWCRVLNRTVMADEETNVLYKMRLELSPINGPTCPATAAFGSPPATDALGGQFEFIGGGGEGPYIVPPFPGPPLIGSWAINYTPSGPSAITQENPGLTSFGTPNDGSFYGVNASVYGPMTWTLDWVIDLGSPQSVCMIVFSAGTGLYDGGDGFAQVWAIDYSDDLLTWANAVGSAAILAALPPAGPNDTVGPPVSTAEPHRYWRLGVSKSIPSGLHYVAGFKMLGIAVYAETP